MRGGRDGTVCGEMGGEVAGREVPWGSDGGGKSLRDGGWTCIKSATAQLPIKCYNSQVQVLQQMLYISLLSSAYSVAINLPYYYC